MNSSSYFEIPKWCEINDRSISVWEGVCAVRIGELVILYKFINDEVYSIELPNQTNRRITSTGYWSCAELKGRFRNGLNFFYHCEDAKKGRSMLETVCQVLRTEIQTLSIRLDPDPLREEKVEWIEWRMQTWREMAESVGARRSRIVLDSNMPL